MLYLWHGLRTSYPYQFRRACALRFLPQEKHYPYQGQEQGRTEKVQAHLELRADRPLVRLPHPVLRWTYDQQYNFLVNSHWSLA